MRFFTTALSLAAIGLMTATWSARAEDATGGNQPFGIGFATAGMKLEDLRTGGQLPEGRRILCDSDADNGLNQGDREVLRVTDAQAAAGLSRCALYAKDEAGTWINRSVGLAGQPAQFYILTLDDNGTRRILQLQLYQDNAAFESTTAQLTKDWGKPVRSDGTAIQWRNSVSDATIARKNDGFYLYISDRALQRAMRQKLGLPTQD